MNDKHKQLLFHCSELLRTFDGEIKSMEEHLDYYLQLNKDLDGEDKFFMTEVFSGCIIYRDVMKVVIDGFFIRDGQNILRLHENTFLVMVYLALFRLDELGISHLRKFVSALDTNTAFKLLNFMCDEKNILTWIKDEWNQIYDPAFVQIHLISPLIRWLPELHDLVKLLRNKIENTKHKTTTSSTTETKPFNLTKPRAKTISVPDEVPKLIKSKPPPKSISISSAVQDAIEKHREENRKKSEQRLMKASKFQFACVNPEKSDKNKQVLQSIIFEGHCKVDANKTKVVSAPDFKKDHFPVNMTSAAILREGLLYQKQENAVIEKLRKLEEGAYDSTDFYKWQSEKQLEDLELEFAALEERKFLGKLSREEAILARTKLITENQAKVQNIKKENAAMMRDYLKQKFQREKEKKQLIENTVAGHKSVKVAKDQIREHRQRIVQDVKVESKDLMKQALEEAEAEMRRKIELIQEIRAMESTPISHMKLVDLTSTPGIGLFSEMSIVELKERLAILKAQRKEQEEVKRDSIINLKQIKANYISETLDMITKHKTEQTKTAAYQMEQHKKKESMGVSFRNDNLVELERKVQAKRADRLKAQQKMLFLSPQKFQGQTTTLISQKIWDTFYQCDD